jgi:hypothetical protein
MRAFSLAIHDQEEEIGHGLAGLIDGDQVIAIPAARHDEVGVAISPRRSR